MLGVCKVCGGSYNLNSSHWQCDAKREAYKEAMKQKYLNEQIQEKHNINQLINRQMEKASKNPHFSTILNINGQEYCLARRELSYDDICLIVYKKTGITPTISISFKDKDKSGKTLIRGEWIDTEKVEFIDVTFTTGA